VDDRNHTAPLNLPRNASVVVFAPHPDDSAISCGALIALSVRAGLHVTIVLVTDGSEAHIPVDFLAQYGWHASWSATDTRALRGRIRVQEGYEEGRRFGLVDASVRLLREQTWHTLHATPLESMTDDLCLRNVADYKAAPLEQTAIAEVSELLESFPSDAPMVVAVPDPNDRLLMHRITVQIVSTSLSRRVDLCARIHTLLLYSCLSSNGETSVGERVLVGFDEATMRQKEHAIRAHMSMRARRRKYGGYDSGSQEFYDSLIRRVNHSTAETAHVEAEFAEQYRLVSRPTFADWEFLRSREA